MHGPVGERLVIDEGAAEEAFAFFGHVFEAEHPVTFDQAQGAAEEVEAVMAGGQAERKGLGEIFVVLEGAVFDEGRGGGGMKLAVDVDRYKIGDAIEGESRRGRGGSEGGGVPAVVGAVLGEAELFEGFGRGEAGGTVSGERFG